MSKQIKWGVLGYAGIAKKKLIPALMESEYAMTYAVASRSAQKLQEAKEQYGFQRFYEDYDALLKDPEVEAVYIPLPNALHKEWTLKALCSGKHVLCEKPMAQTPQDCQEMIECAKKNNVLLVEAFMYRFGKRMEIVSQLLKDGVLGEIRAIYSSHRFVLHDHKNVRVNASLGGGSIWDVGCYPVNLIGLIMGCEPVSIKTEKIDFQGVDASLSSVLRYENGTICTINCGFGAQGINLTEISGDKGVMVIRNTFSDMDEPEPAPILLIRDGKTEEIPVPAFHTYTMEVDAFCKALLNGRMLEYDTQESVRTARVINRILESAK